MIKNMMESDSEEGIKAFIEKGSQTGVKMNSFY